MKDTPNIKFSIREYGVREYDIQPYNELGESYFGKVFIEHYIAFASPMMYKNPTTIAIAECNKTNKGVVLTSTGLLKLKDKRVSEEPRILTNTDIKADIMAMIEKGLDLQEYGIEVMESPVFMLNFYQGDPKNVFEAHVMEHNLTYNPVADIERVSRMLYWFIHKDAVTGTM